MAEIRMDYRVSNLVRKILEKHKVNKHEVFSCYLYLEMPGSTVPAHMSHTGSPLENVVRYLLSNLDDNALTPYGRIVGERGKELYRNYNR